MEWHDHLHNNNQTKMTSSNLLGPWNHLTRTTVQRRLGHLWAPPTQHLQPNTPGRMNLMVSHLRCCDNGALVCNWLDRRHMRHWRATTQKHVSIERWTNGINLVFQRVLWVTLGLQHVLVLHNVGRTLCETTHGICEPRSMSMMPP